MPNKFLYRNIFDVAIISLLFLSVFFTYQFDWWNRGEVFQIQLLFLAVPMAFAIKFLKLDYTKAAVFLFLILIAGHGGIGVVFSVFLIWITAYLLGRCLVLCFYKNFQIDPIYQAALGLSIVGLVFLVASHFRVNYNLTYLLFFLAIGLISSFFCPIKYEKISFGSALNIPFIYGVLIILVLSYIYMATVIPDTGHDAISAHLTIPRKIAENHYWRYSFEEYIWSLLPLGAEMLFTPAYMFGGEGAVRLLNTSFLLATIYIIYINIYKFTLSSTIAIGFSLVFASLPMSIALVNTTSIEPAFTFFLISAASLFLNDKKPWLMLTAIFGFACTMRISGFLFAPLLFIYLAVVKIGSRNKEINLFFCILIFLLFSSINYIYAYHITGSPIFPLMNEFFKSNFYSKEAFYHPLFVNDYGIKNYFLMIFNSKAYTQVASNGAVGIILALIAPIGILLTLVIGGKKSEKLLFISVLIFIAAIFKYQAYLRYIYPVFPIFLIAFSSYLSAIPYRRPVLNVILILVIGINLFKIPYAGAYVFMPSEYKLYFDGAEGIKFLQRSKPYLSIGRFLATSKEFNDKKILLVGAGYDPAYYYYPDNTAAYSWHSDKAFTLINKYSGDLKMAIKELNVDVVVCPEIQSQDDKFKFASQCQSASKQIMLMDGVYVGRVVKN